MSGQQDLTFTLELGGPNSKGARSQENGEILNDGIPRIARLLALAIRLEGLIREGTLRDYADVAQRGQVTRARMTQIMKLLSLAPDIQEQILFLAAGGILNERKLRPVAATIDWSEQRRLFHKIVGRAAAR